MCVIAGSPLGVPRPSDKTMEAMFTSNPDGAGFAYTMDNKVYVEKGFMSYQEFENALAGLEKRLKKDNLTCSDIPMFFHFRIGTHGANIPALTHPFPISKNINNLFALDYTTDIVMAHNGIINTVNVTGAHSDTTEYISKILVPLRNVDTEFYNNPHFQELMQNTIDGSRFIFLNDMGDMVTIGSWLTSDKEPGILFSNLHHEWSYDLLSRKTKYFPPSRYDDYYSTYDELATVKAIPEGFYLTADDNIQHVVQGTEEYPVGFYLVNPSLVESTSDSPYGFYIEKTYGGLVVDLDPTRSVGEYMYDLNVICKIVDDKTGRIELFEFDDIDGGIDTMRIGF